MTDHLQFLELSIPAADVQESLAWYRAIGFSELPTTEARPRQYAVISNGEICIGLHGETLDRPGLTFVRRDLAQFARSRLAAGQEFERCDLGVDEFHEVRQRDPDGLLAILLEARTFSPGHIDVGNRTIGKLLNVVLPCLDVSDSLGFWQGYGFIGVENPASGTVELHMPGLTLNLSAANRYLTLRFQPYDFDASMQELRRDHAVKAISATAGRGAEITAPEGTRIQLLDLEGSQALPRN